MIKHIFRLKDRGSAQMSHPIHAKVTSLNSTGTDDDQMPVGEEGRGVEVSN